jgi:ActR/RegA family two-component response regulator
MRRVAHAPAFARRRLAVIGRYTDTRIPAIVGAIMRRLELELELELEGVARVELEAAAAGVDLTLASTERDHIAMVLGLVRGDLSAAARMLGVNRRTLQRRKHRRPRR